MKFIKNTLSLLLIIMIHFSVQAERAMYVNGFASILDDETAENTLLNFAIANGIETLLLYELHIVHGSHDLTSAVTNQVLADFIYKAKNNYGLLKIGAVGESAAFFSSRIDAYNNTRTNALEKFDIYNLEFEFWVNASVNSGGYYCTTYLTSGGFTCDNDGAFQFFIQELTVIKTLATNNAHSIRTEAYVGWPTTAQAATIGSNLDQVLVHAYVSHPSTAFGYADDRLIDFATGNPNIKVSLIFSAEPAFMQSWLQANNILTAENTFTTDWANGSTGWANNINLTGFTYFAYGFMTNIVLPVELISFDGHWIDNTIQLNWTTATEINAGYFEIERRLEYDQFESIATVEATGNSLEAVNYQCIDKNPLPHTNYYRLKQVDKNGIIDYSNVITVQQKTVEITPNYPTIANNILSIKIPKSTDRLYIFNTAGQLIQQIKITAQQINISALPQGIYFLKWDTKGQAIRFVKM